jgi:hypothetical protein
VGASFLDKKAACPQSLISFQSAVLEIPELDMPAVGKIGVEPVDRMWISYPGILR